MVHIFTDDALAAPTARRKRECGTVLP